MMNDRIKELAEQAGLATQHNGIVLTKNVNAAEAFEKFAELIVRECAEWMASGNIADGFYEAPRMLKHFGIEE